MDAIRRSACKRNFGKLQTRCYDKSQSDPDVLHTAAICRLCVQNGEAYRVIMVAGTYLNRHGTADGVLLMGPHDRSEPVTADRLIQMFRWTWENLRMVFFNICASEQRARGAAQFVSAIRMRGTMRVASARVFAAHLYSSPAFGNSLYRAFHQAGTAIGDEPDSMVPQLFFRHCLDPHEVVLVRPEGGDAT